MTKGNIIARALPLVVFVLSCGGQPARANLGESFNQINARYGAPQKIPDSTVNDDVASVYKYLLNGSTIFVSFMDGKSSAETVRAPDDKPQFSGESCLTMASTLSGETNWFELNRTAGFTCWVATNATVLLQHEAGHHDFLTVASLNWTKYEIQLTRVEPSPFAGFYGKNTDLAKGTEPDLPARVLKWQQQLADSGDAYAQYRMGLRYRNGDGVPKNLDKARELLKKAASLNDKDAAAALRLLQNEPASK